MMSGRTFYSRVCSVCAAVTVAYFGKPWQCSGDSCDGTPPQDEPSLKSLTVYLTDAELARIKRFAEITGGTPSDVVGAAVFSYGSDLKGRRRRKH